MFRNFVLYIGEYQELAALIFSSEYKVCAIIK